jgi:hypothetical protein
MTRTLPIAALAAACLFIGLFPAFADPACPGGSNSVAEMKAATKAAARAEGRRVIMAESSGPEFSVLGVVMEGYRSGALYFFVKGCGVAQNRGVAPAQMQAILARAGAI